MKTAIANYYEPLKARKLVAYAAAAYGENGMMDGGQCVDDRATDTRAVVWRDEDGDVVVAFRGTRSLRNFVTDVCARRVSFWNGCPGDVEVHAGFLRALNSIYVGVYGVVERMLGDKAKPGLDGVSPYQDRRLWVTGHSLGGALAKLFAVRCKMPMAGVYTFGEPRVGNAGFRDYYDALLKSCTFRVVDAEDFITRIPWLLGAYRHCGTEVFYDCTGVARVNPRWWEKAVSDVLGTWEEYRDEGRLALLEDHHVRRYVRLLSEECGVKSEECEAAKS